MPRRQKSKALLKAEKQFESAVTAYIASLGARTGSSRRIR
jgi:hypothetical protein